MTKEILHRRLGWKNSLPDLRDKAFKFVPLHTTGEVPPKADLSPKINWIYDQGDEGSCTAQSTASMVRFERNLLGLSEIDPSRNWIYWNERNAEGSVKTDAGAQLRTAMKVVNQLGICHESMWNYSPSTLYATPAKATYTDAAKNVVSVYQSVEQDHTAMRSCIASGHPFVVGFSVYESFMSDAVAANGIVPMPGSNENQVGGHAVMVVGYDDESKYYKIMNSWSAKWGANGYFYMPYDYMEDPDMADDFWTIRNFKEVKVTYVPKKPVFRPWWKWW